jgi:hypothetical protein
MKPFLIKTVLLGCTAFLYNICSAQEDWPKTLTASDGIIIKIYQPQPDSFAGNILKSRSAISVLEKGSPDPAFGTLWSTAKVATDRDNRTVAIESISISDIKIPADSAKTRLDHIKATLESKLPQAAGQIPLDELLTSLDQNLDETKLSKDINTQVPKIIYVTHPSVLVIIDGVPDLQKNKKWGVDAVINSPFTIVRDRDNQFYLYGGQHWYTASLPTGPYSYVSGKVSGRLRKIEKAFARNKTDQINNGGDNAVADTTIPAIIVSTTPAELIQTDSVPQFLPIPGTALLYIGNTTNDIFMDTRTEQYFVLISGRWYQSKTLAADSKWQYIASDKLPADFARIPEGSPKDNVLASVAGTDAAREALMDAQIPQTAKVDRKTATTQVAYDGDPQFQIIKGTRLQYAINTSSTVLQYEGRYYAVDNGVWFVSDNPSGPWVASTQRPGDLDLIPPSSPVYNTKFVDIYDTEPDYIYTGYTPGYLNSYVYGPTVVYGTGFYYEPWIGNYYYPRPWSWGFDMGYDPWYGWSFGPGYGFDWFNMGFGFGWGGWYGGWWGPSFYHPAAWGYGRGDRPHSFYGRDVPINRNGYVHSNNNIYRNRRGIAPRNGSAYAAGRNNNNRAGFMNDRSGGRGENNVMSDRQGNVYQRGAQGGWQQRSIRGGTQTDHFPAQVSGNLNRQQQMRDRGQMRAMNFQRVRAFSAPGFGGSRGGFGGGRRR